MGYTLTIGNAVPEFSKDYGELYARWVVESTDRPDSPALPNDTNPRKNYRWPSYSGWANFCREAGIYPLFYGDDPQARGGLLENHPGCVLLTEEHYKVVADALVARKAIAEHPPGFMLDEGYPIPQDGTPGEFDAILGRLVWLEWWMRWALDNCETPAIGNS